MTFHQIVPVCLGKVRRHDVCICRWDACFCALYKVDIFLCRRLSRVHLHGPRHIVKSKTLNWGACGTRQVAILSKTHDTLEISKNAGCLKSLKRGTKNDREEEEMEEPNVMPKREEPCLPMQLIGSHKMFLTGGKKEGSTLTGRLTYHRGCCWYPSWGMFKPGNDESRESRVLLGQLVGKMRRIPYGTVQSRKQQWSLYFVIGDSA